MFRRCMWCLIPVVAVCALPLGCNIFVNPPDEETNKSELKAFASEAELVAYMREQIELRNASVSGYYRDEDSPSAPTGENQDSDGSGGPTPAPGDPNLSAGDDGDGHSGTTTQEAGVDEADVVKTDGQNLYVLSGRNSDSVLRIVGIGPAGQTQLLSELELEGYGRDIYLYGNTVVALTTGGGFVYPIFLEGVPVAVDVDEGVATTDEISEADAISSDIGLLPPDEYVYERPSTRAIVIDVSDRTAPAVRSSTKIDGSIASSRMVQGVMHLVLANYENYYYDVLPTLGMPQVHVEDVDAEMILPKYTRTNADGTEESGNVVTWEDLYHPVDPDGFGVVTVVNMDIDADAQFEAVGVVAEPGLIYSSVEALYLTDTNYDWQGRSRTTTDLYKFKYEGRGATPVAFGSVEGRILNQYSMGEHNGHLRVATTIDPSWDFDFFGNGQQITEASNRVYVLGQSDSQLNVVGSIQNIAPGETIQSARFLGDRGFLVTFRQIDPLFTLDLSNPAAPSLVGELKVPGFSTFLTPIDANHLLAVGQYVPPPETPGNWGVQLSIFDVTDFANPALKSNVILGADSNTSAYSEALWDPKALTYFAEGGVVALPMSIYEYSWDVGGGGVVDGGGREPLPDGDMDGGGTSGSSEGSTGSAGEEVDVDAPPPDDVIDPIEPGEDIIMPQIQGFEGVYVFSVSAESGLTELGRVSTRFDETQYWGASFTRGVFVGQNLFAVTDLGVHSATLGDLATMQSELFFGLPYDVDDQPLPTEPAHGDDPVKGDGDIPLSSDGAMVTQPATPVLGSEVNP